MVGGEEGVALLPALTLSRNLNPPQCCLTLWPQAKGKYGVTAAYGLPVPVHEMRSS